MKLYRLMGANEVVVVKTGDNINNPKYTIYRSDARMVWFIIMIPILGNLIALLLWILSLGDKIGINEDSPKPKILFKGN